MECRATSDVEEDRTTWRSVQRSSLEDRAGSGWLIDRDVDFVDLVIQTVTVNATQTCVRRMMLMTVEAGLCTRQHTNTQA